MVEYENEEHEKYAKLLLKKDLTIEQVADRLGVSESTVHQKKKKYNIYKTEIARLRSDD